MSQIKGISDVVRLPKLDRIRLGIKKKIKDGYFTEPTDYFICPPEVRKVFGDKPDALRIMFPNEEKHRWSNLFLHCYSASRELICRGDGETALTRVYKDTGVTAAGDVTNTGIREITCNPDTCAYYRQGQCRWVMNLQFLIPDCPGFGIYEIGTASPYSILNINLALRLIHSIYGRLSMLPLCLRLDKHEVKSEENKKTERFLRLDVCQAVGEIRKDAHVPGAQEFLLPAPDSEAPDDFFISDHSMVGEKNQSSINHDEELINLWTMIISKILHFDIQDYQITNWFEKNYHIEVHLLDFDPPRPPARFTTEMLTAFNKSIDHYAGR